MHSLLEAVAAGAALALLPVVAARAQDEPGVLVVFVEGIEKAQGQMVVELFDSADDFPGQAAFSQTMAATTDADFSLSFEGVPPGDYAVYAWQDVDADGKLERSLMGRAKEPVGFSNGARFGFAPPPFADAAFRIGPGLNEVVIRF